MHLVQQQQQQQQLQASPGPDPQAHEWRKTRVSPQETPSRVAVGGPSGESRQEDGDQTKSRKQYDKA